MNIAYLTYKQIDKTKWDDCINNAVNGLIYARSFYLDSMAPGWDSVVAGDYEAVMPLAWKKKWGIPYLYQPAFIQQGGVFCRKKLNKETLDVIITTALNKFRFVETTLNYGNEIKETSIPLEISYRNNFVLDLEHSYENLYANYDASFTKSLRRIKKFELHYSSSTEYKITIRLYKDLYSSRLPYFSPKDFLHFEKVCDHLAAENNLIVRHAIGAENTLLASVILLKDEKRLYNIISCVTEQGKKLEASYFLYDRIIHEFAGKIFLLDFEGSDVPGIADFYKKFNPQNQAYPFIKYNNLYPLLKIFKR